MNSRVLLTGASGLIGKEAILPLLQAGFTIYALSRKDKKSELSSRIIPIACDLFDERAVDRACCHAQAQYLLHFAWNVKEDWAISHENIYWFETGKQLLHHFAKWGGSRIIMAGSCAEYAVQDRDIPENAPLANENLYAANKNALREYAENFCHKNGLSFGWGRIFNAFGHNEYRGRLTAYLIDNFQRGCPVTLRHGSLVRDYMYAKDIASAFVAFLSSDVEGSVNICTGQGISLGDYARIFSDKFGCSDLLTVLDEPTNQPPRIVGDNKRLSTEVAFHPRFNLNKAVDDIIQIILKKGTI